MRLITSVRVPAPSMAYVGYLRCEGFWSIVVGSASLALFPLPMAPGAELTPADVIGVGAALTVLVRGVCMRRVARGVTARTSGGLTTRESAVVRWRLTVLLGVVVLVGVLPADEWVVSQLLLGVLGICYGTGVLVRTVSAARASRVRMA